MKTVLADTNIILWTFNGGPDFREAIDIAMPGAKVVIPSCVISVSYTHLTLPTNREV